MNWYRLPGKTSLTIIMVIAMANIPRRMTAGRMIELSMSSFGAVSIQKNLDQVIHKRNLL